MSEQAAFQAIVHGRVQGVYFRAFVQERAKALGLTGYVKNLSSGRSIEVWAEGEKEKLEELLNHLKVGPPRSRVERVDVEWSEYSGLYSRFGVNY
jgi:acylphosphatase